MLEMKQKSKVSEKTESTMTKKATSGINLKNSIKKEYTIHNAYIKKEAIIGSYNNSLIIIFSIGDNLYSTLIDSRWIHDIQYSAYLNVGIAEQYEYNVRNIETKEKDVISGKDLYNVFLENFTINQIIALHSSKKSK